MENKELKNISDYLGNDKFLSKKMLTDYNYVMEAYALVIEKFKLTLTKVNSIFSVSSPSTISIEAYIILMNDIITTDIMFNKEHEEILVQRELKNKREAEKKAKEEQAIIDKENKRRVYKYESSEKRKIEDWLKDAMGYITNKDYDINDDLSIDCYVELYLSKYLSTHNITELPYKFNCSRHMWLGGSPLNSLKNFPTILLKNPLDSTIYLGDRSNIKVPYNNSKYFHSNVSTSEYENFLFKAHSNNIDGAQEILNLLKEAKKYIIILKNSANNTYIVYEKDKYLYQAKYDMYHSPWKIGDEDYSYHSYEEDLGLYDYDTKWTEEEFKERSPQADLEKSKKDKEDKIKKEALSKLSEKERELLGL